MFYKAIGYVTWNAAKWYVRRRVGTTAKVFGGLAAATVIATVVYVIASGNGDSDGSQSE